MTAILRIWLLAMIAALAMLTPGSAAAETAETSPALPTISPEELVRGQKGYGLSVFRGTELERFDVEVLGVLRNAAPGVSYILARLSGQGLERSGVIAGMSGSPVYFDGRLAGAVAFSYLFGLDPIAGITPIAAMRRLGEQPLRSGAPGGGSGSGVPAAGPGRGSLSVPAALKVTFDDLLQRDFERSQLDEVLADLATPALSGASPALHWTAAGFSAAAQGILQQAFAGLPVAAGSGGGGAATDAAAGSAALVPGSAVAAVLVDGDFSLAAHGTVTDRHGDQILAFGHPVFSLGPVNLPLATSEVITVIDSAFNSFKLSNAGPALGAFDQDRQAGVRGLLGTEAPTTPLRVELRGLAEREYHMRVANLPQMRPLLMAISALSALDAGSYAGGPQGLDLEARFRIDGHDELLVRQSFDSDSAGMESVLYLLNYAAYIEFNTLEEVSLQAVDVALTQVERPRSATLVAAHAERRRLEPGQTAAVSLELQAFRGERFRRQIEVEIPDQVPDGKYFVLLGDGTSMDAVRLAVEQSSPQTFAQSLRLLGSFHPRSELQILGLLPGPGMTVAGEALPDLPGSMRKIFAASPAPTPPQLVLAIAHRQLITMDRPIEGVVRIDLEVRRKSV